MLFRVADCSSSRLHVEEDSLENRNIFEVRILPPGSLTFHVLSRVFHLEIRRGGPLDLHCKSRFTYLVQRGLALSRGRERRDCWMDDKGG